MFFFEILDILISSLLLDKPLISWLSILISFFFGNLLSLNENSPYFLSRLLFVVKNSFLLSLFFLLFSESYLLFYYFRLWSLATMKFFCIPLKSMLFLWSNFFKMSSAVTKADYFFVLYVLEVLYYLSLDTLSFEFGAPER